MWLPYLDALVTRWASGTDRASSPSAHWREAHDLASHVLRTWKPSRRYPGRSEHESNAARMLELLARLGDTQCIDSFVAGICAVGDYGADDDDACCRPSAN